MSGTAASAVVAGVASAPPMENMETLGGYEYVSFVQKTLPPPSNAGMRGPSAQRGELDNYPTLTEEQAREAIVQFATERCCYGKKAAREMVFQGLETTPAFHYTLETFSEKRETVWAVEPYTGQHIDYSSSGPAPGPWDVSVPITNFFQDRQIKVEVPRTASVKPCHECAQIGRKRCHSCLGDGQELCPFCHGSGRSAIQHGVGHGHHHHHDHHHDHHRNHHHDHHHGHHHGHHHQHDEHQLTNCVHCNGSGRRRCSTCFGHGQVPCKTCAARGQLKCFIQMTVTWKTHKDDFVMERTTLPEELIRKVSGQVAFQEEMSQVWPLNQFAEVAVNAKSAELLQLHSHKCGSERILRQRHQVRIVPVGQAYFHWKNKTNSFFVYGFENYVHAPGYPQRFCCGCSIL